MPTQPVVSPEPATRIAASSRPTPRLLRWFLPLLVAATTVLVFRPVVENELLSYEDFRYITNNKGVIGLGSEQVSNMLTWTTRGYCEPITWLSYTFDLHASGLSARGVHATNLALHVVAALLVYAVAVQLLAAAAVTNQRTPATYIGAAVAALLFSVHPLRTEPVAWASARAYPLAAIFALLTVLCYVRSIAPGNTGSRRRVFLGLAVLCYQASLMSAPLAIALPVVLFVLDFYPFRRVGALAVAGRPGRGVLVEKLPFLLALGLTLALMPVIQAQLDQYNSQFSASVRLVRSASSAGLALLKTLCPSGLSPLYELPPGHEPSTGIAIAWATALLALTIAALVIRKRVPAATTAWFCWLLLFVPLSGVIHYGTQLAADRYAYLPGIAAALLAGAAVSYAVASHPAWIRYATGGLCLGVIAVFSGVAHKNATYWRDSETLFRRALAVNAQSHTAMWMLANEYAAQGRQREAADFYGKALTVAPENFFALKGLAALEGRRGRIDEATELYRRALKVNDNPDLRTDYALCLAKHGRLDEAIAAALPLVGSDPLEVDALKYLEDFVEEDHPTAVALYVRHLQLNTKGAPDVSAPDVLNNLAWLRATSPDPKIRNGREAVELATKALRLKPDIEFKDTLAAAYAETGDFAKAIEIQAEVMNTAAQFGADDEAFRTHMKAFQQRRPVREPATMPAESRPTTQPSAN